MLADCQGGAMQVRLDAGQAQSQRLPDFLQLHFLYKAQHEYRALARRQLGYGAPHSGNLFAGDERLLGAGAPVRHTLDCFPWSVASRSRDARLRMSKQPSPETRAAIAAIVGGQVQGDAHQPGINSRLSPIAVPLLVRPQE